MGEEGKVHVHSVRGDQSPARWLSKLWALARAADR